MHSAPLVNSLAARGHHVFASLRDPAACVGVFDPAIVILPAPFRTDRGTPPSLTVSFANILHDMAFGDDRALCGLTAAWRSLFQLVRPDLVLFDHSPTALLASRGLRFKRLVLGPGFNVVPDKHPLPSIRPWDGPQESTLVALEESLLKRCNGLLQSWDQPPLDHLGQLYSQVDDTFLLTFPELDCYREHRPPGIRYSGPVLGPGGGNPPEWPGGNGPRVYAYLRQFPAIDEVIRYLRARNLSSIIYVPMLALRDRLNREFAGASLRFESVPLDLKQTGKECSLAITHGGHGTTAALLLSGVPALHLPLHPEMGLNARAVRRLGAGLDGPVDQPPRIFASIEELLSAPRYKAAAQRCAARHANFDSEAELEVMLNQIHDHLTSRT
jgi:UDP:flavonoid glycosyltransferase YjiC (YdhE family)